MIYCPNCGSKQTGNTCSNCGETLTTENAVSNLELNEMKSAAEMMAQMMAADDLKFQMSQKQSVVQGQEEDLDAQILQMDEETFQQYMQIQMMRLTDLKNSHQMALEFDRQTNLMSMSTSMVAKMKQDWDLRIKEKKFELEEMELEAKIQLLMCKRSEALITVKG